MKKIENLPDLLVQNLRALHASETQLKNGLFDLQQKATSGTLRSVINNYDRTKGRNIERLRHCMNLLGLTHGKGNCDIIQALLADCRSIAGQTMEKPVTDVALIGCLQQINHFYIARYGSAAAYANALGKDDIAIQLHHAAQDEKATDAQFSEIALEHINIAAIITA